MSLAYQDSLKLFTCSRPVFLNRRVAGGFLAIRETLPQKYKVSLYDQIHDRIFLKNKIYIYQNMNIFNTFKVFCWKEEGKSGLKRLPNGIGFFQTQN